MRNERSREDRLIEELFARHAADGRSVLLGPGDDAAVLRCPPGEELLITTDTLNEEVHFPAGMPPHALGHRALAVSLSDLAAMGARPLWVLVALSVPAAGEGWLKEFADGLHSLADGLGVRVVGGDFVRGPLSVTVTAHGSAPSQATLRRDGANAGDGIWVSGTLGDAAAGLKLLQAGKESVGPCTKAGGLRSHRPQTGRAAEDKLIRRFCYPRPRLDLGRELVKAANACMDLSDGLCNDLPRLLRNSGLAARVEVERLPLSAGLKAYAGLEQARQMAWSGGDDYELCFTVAPANEYRLATFSSDVTMTRIGELGEGQGLQATLDGAAWQVAEAGFAHF